MTGIDLNGAINYIYSSMKYFKENERHITRICNSEVLLLMLEGELSFCEDGIEYVLKPGEYHIQRKGSFQEGRCPSLKPVYFYIHFNANWAENGQLLPKRGCFDVNKFAPLINEMEKRSSEYSTLTECTQAFLGILIELYRKKKNNTVADEIAEYIQNNLQRDVGLSEISEKFHFTKNHIINIFKSEYNQTPMEYKINLKVKKAVMLMEATSLTVEEIVYACGFSDYSHFYKQFYKIYLISPAKWRKARRTELDNEARIEKGK